MDPTRIAEDELRDPAILEDITTPALCLMQNKLLFIRLATFSWYSVVYHCHLLSEPALSVSNLSYKSSSVGLNHRSQPLLLRGITEPLCCCWFTPLFLFRTTFNINTVKTSRELQFWIFSNPITYHSSDGDSSLKPLCLPTSSKTLSFRTWHIWWFICFIASSVSSWGPTTPKNQEVLHCLLCNEV